MGIPAALNKVTVAGLFVLTLFASHLASTPAVYAQANYQLAYNLNYTAAYPGSTSTMISLLKNQGTVAIRVTAITLTLDFGSYSATSGIPLVIPIGQSSTVNMSVMIPSSTTVGSHAASTSISFQYQDPNSGQWVTPTLSPLLVQGSMNVQSNPGPTLSGAILATFYGLIAGLVGGGVVYLYRRRKKRAAGMTQPQLQPVEPPAPGS